jgi:hypothetical protein
LGILHHDGTFIVLPLFIPAPTTAYEWFERATGGHVWVRKSFVGGEKMTGFEI